MAGIGTFQAIVSRLGAVTLVAALVAGAGCATIPVASMVKLRNFGIESADFSKLYAAVRLPEAFEPGKRGLTLKLQVDVEKGPQGEHQTFALEQVSDAAEFERLRSASAPGTRIFVFRIAVTDLPRIAAARREILRLKTLYGKNARGSLTLDADTCLRQAPPEGPLFLTTYLRPDPDTGYVVLNRDVNMRELFLDRLDQIPRCANTGDGTTVSALRAAP